VSLFSRRSPSKIAARPESSLSHEMRPADPAAIDRMKGTLVARGITKSYNGRQVVNGVSFGVRSGEAVGILGPNGAGKTTCFYMVTGLVPVDKGTIEIDGFDVTTMPMYRRSRLGIGYLPQEASIFRGLSVENNIKAVLEVVEKDRGARAQELDSLLEEFHIAHLRKAPAMSLSGGERRRLEIARALASRPNFMLLDEPFAGVDPIAVADIQQLVRHLTGSACSSRTTTCARRSSSLTGPTSFMPARYSPMADRMKLLLILMSAAFISGISSGSEFVIFRCLWVRKCILRPRFG
jgi:lipopolysaccharide export system ATP-binding protein